MCAANPSSFYADELHRALQEQSFGIESFSMENATSLQATATVKILEGLNVTLKLTIRGFTVCNIMFRTAASNLLFSSNQTS